MALDHAKSGEVVDLRPLKEKLRDARSTAIVKSGHFEAVRLIVHAGQAWPSHEVSGNITLHCLEGHIELGLGQNVIAMKPGDWIWLDGGEPHSVTGIEDSCLLLTILFDA